MPSLYFSIRITRTLFPASIAMVALGLAFLGASPASANPTGTLAESMSSPGTPASIIEVVYKTIPTRDLKLWLYRPANWQPTDQRPAIVLFHGGGWGGGDPSRLAFQASHYQNQGFVAILAAYSLRDTDNSFTEDSIRDARSALRWIKANAAAEGIDATTIVAGGGSSGAHLAMGTAMFGSLDDASDDLSVDPRPFAIVAWNPVVDTSPPDGFGTWTFLGDPALGSPMDRITADLPPIIIMHGDADTSIPIEQARAFRDAYAVAGNTVLFHEYAGAGHGFFNNEPPRSETLAQIDDFLNELGLLPVPEQPVPAHLKATFSLSSAMATTGEAIDLDASASEGSIVRYIWELGDGYGHEGGEPFYSHQWNSRGPKAVRLTVVDASGRSDTTTRVIRIIGEGEVGGNGWVNTEDWLGWIYAKHDPYWWIMALDTWGYAPPEADGWINLLRK